MSVGFELFGACELFGEMKLGSYTLDEAPSAYCAFDSEAASGCFDLVELHYKGELLCSWEKDTGRPRGVFAYMGTAA